MAHSINTRKTQDGKWVGSVDTKAYGAGYSLFKTEPFADRGEAYQAALAWRTEQTAANAVKKAEKNTRQMTCQCCARKHLANTGKIAHHGYERPGYGWQTASCMGARELPFEVDRDALAHLITILEGRKAMMTTFRNDTASETISIGCTWETGRKADRQTHSFEFTRDNFDSEDGKAARRAVYYYGDNFAEMLQSELASQDRKLEMITRDINECQKRYNGWKQTHIWNTTTKEWNKL